MLLKDNKLFKLPTLMGSWISGLERVYLPHNMLILKEVTQRNDNGDIQLMCQAKDGYEVRQGGVLFSVDDRLPKDILYQWLKQQIGKDIETIYHSEFIFGEEITKKCPRCSSEMFESMEPKIANLADITSNFPKQNKQWRCSNRTCNYREKI